MYNEENQVTAAQKEIAKAVGEKIVTLLDGYDGTIKLTALQMVLSFMIAVHAEDPEDACEEIYDAIISNVPEFVRLAESQGLRERAED